jgi:hypothetical protein
MINPVKQNARAAALIESRIDQRSGLASEHHRSGPLCQPAALKKKVKNPFSSDISLLHLLDESDASKELRWV